jgi:two-component system, chemotaxis family, CheB/CheR fusion protein
MGDPRLRVLIIEDDRPLASMLREAIEADGHEVCVAHDAPSAIAACQSFKPTAVLIDIGLPETDGYSLAERLREQVCADSVRIAAVTGYSMPAYWGKSRVAGFDRHITKPVDLAALGRLLSAWADELEG